MREEELLKIGFERYDILNEESSNGYDYYYYILNLCNGVCLVSSDSDRVTNDFWTIKCFDIPDLKIEDAEKLMRFITFMETMTT